MELETFSILEPGSGKRFNLSKVYTVDNLGLPEQALNFEQLSKEFEHLRQFPLKSFQRTIPGLSNSHLLTTVKIREGKEKEPIATKTRIGWAVSQWSCMRGRKTISPPMHRFVRPRFEQLRPGVSLCGKPWSCHSSNPGR